MILNNKYRKKLTTGVADPDYFVSVRFPTMKQAIFLKAVKEKGTGRRKKVEFLTQVMLKKEFI
jgi:hypothetical protein